MVRRLKTRSFTTMVNRIKGSVTAVLAMAVLAIGGTAFAAQAESPKADAPKAKVETPKVERKVDTNLHIFGKERVRYDNNESEGKQNTE